MIPKIFHWIWMGDLPLHPLMVEWQAGWSRLHPDWTLKLWTDATGSRYLTCGSERLESRHPTLLKRSCHMGQRANIWRYDILERQGGVYLDTDFEPVKNIEPLIEGLDAFAGKTITLIPSECLERCADGKFLKVGNAIIGAAPHHPFLQDLMNRLPERDPKKTMSMGFGFITLIAGSHPEVKLFESDVFYPRQFEPTRASKEKPLDYQPHPDSYAIHRWSGFWFPTYDRDRM